MWFEFFFFGYLVIRNRFEVRLSSSTIWTFSCTIDSHWLYLYKWINIHLSPRLSVANSMVTLHTFSNVQHLFGWFRLGGLFVYGYWNLKGYARWRRGRLWIMTLWITFRRDLLPYTYSFNHLYQWNIFQVLFVVLYCLNDLILNCERL